MPERTNAAWLEALSAHAGPDPEALADLRSHLQRAALFAIRRRLATAHGVMVDEIDSLAEDCAQEAIVLMLQNIGTFRGEARFVTWASAIAVGVAMATLRRRLWRDLSLDHMPDGWQEPASSATSSSGWEHPHLAALRTEIWSVIKDVVERDLTDRQRQTSSVAGPEWSATGPSMHGARRYGKRSAATATRSSSSWTNTVSRVSQPGGLRGAHHNQPFSRARSRRRLRACFGRLMRRWCSKRGRRRELHLDRVVDRGPLVWRWLVPGGSRTSFPSPPPTAARTTTAARTQRRPRLPRVR
jgi:RNA polymerase sigma-70 factor (ECF subfamily)